MNWEVYEGYENEKQIAIEDPIDALRKTGWKVGQKLYSSDDGIYENIKIFEFMVVAVEEDYGRVMVICCNCFTPKRVDLPFIAAERHCLTDDPKIALKEQLENFRSSLNESEREETEEQKEERKKAEMAIRGEQPIDSFIFGFTDRDY